ncbi:MAG: hypothetical protein B7X06_04230 [Verrucomicrobia bacterium 21-51-4]|nr:MAG: hypothetical protein B7X06_04230 [Verrucomicrobia bacterium 21-51-4]
MALAIDLFRAFGLSERDFVLRLSDRTLWLAYLGCYGIEGEQALGALNIIDKLEREDRAEVLKKLQAVMPDAAQAEALLTGIEAKMKIRTLPELEAFLDELAAKDERLRARLQDWRKLMQDLEAMQMLPFVQIDLGIVRGLAYYTGFVFEIFTREGKSRALAGGGRYDELVEKLGGPALHALGFAIGDVTLQDLLAEKKLIPSYQPRADVFIVMAGDSGLKAGLGMAAKLRRMQVAAEYTYKDNSIGKQLKLADQKNIRWVAICAEDELAREEILIKDLKNQTQTAVPLEHAAEILRDLCGGALGGGCCGGGGCGSNDDSAGGCCGG